MRALRWIDFVVVCVGGLFFCLHFALSGFPSHLLSPWLIGSIVTGWIFARIALDRIEAIRDLVFEGRALRIRAQRGATTVPPILAALELGGISVRSVRIASPSLDDVYLRHTGRSFSEADAVGAR